MQNYHIHLTFWMMGGLQADNIHEIIFIFKLLLLILVTHSKLKCSKKKKVDEIAHSHANNSRL